MCAYVNEIDIFIMSKLYQDWISPIIEKWKEKRKKTIDEGQRCMTVLEARGMDDKRTIVRTLSYFNNLNSIASLENIEQINYIKTYNVISFE